MTTELNEGSRAPGFTLPGSGGGTVDLGGFAGQPLVLYFYPKADTPGCTIEAMDFSRLKPLFEAAGTAVLGVSADAVAAQDKFLKKHALTTPLLSDESHSMLEAYGVWGEKSMFGKKYMGIERTTFLIGPDGRIARIWRKVKVEGHAAEVLEAANALVERI